MKIRYNVNICDNGPHRNELMIHFTKICPNNCSFCIDKLNTGVNRKVPDILAITNTIKRFKDKVKHVTISGGEPFAFIDTLEGLVNWIKNNTDLTITLITSVPNVCYEKKEQFLRILDRCDDVQFSLQHYFNGIGDEIRQSKSNFDRNLFYKEVLEHCGPDKILGTINILKPHFEHSFDIISNVILFNQLGFKNIKICEMFDADNLYIDIPKTLGIKLNSAFASGCKIEYKKANTWNYNGHYFNGHLYIKRSCFYRTKHQKASIWDLIKISTRWIFDKDYFFGVIHEDGTIAPYWI